MLIIIIYHHVPFNHYRSLQGQLTSYSLLFALIPVVIVAIVAFFQARSSLRQQINFSIQELAAATSADAERLLESRRGDIEVMAQSPILISLESTSEQKSEFLRSISDAYGIYSALYMTDTQGTIIAATDNTTSDQSHQVWFQNAIREELYISDVYFLTSVQGFVVTFSAPVKTVTGDLIGVVAGHMDADVLNALVAAKQLGETGEIILINSEGRVVAAQDREEIFDDASDMISDHAALNGQSGVVESIDFHGEKALIGYVPLTSIQDWIVIGILPMTEVNEPVNRLAINITIIGSLVTSIIVITIFIITQRIVQPIIELTAAAKQIGAGNLSYRLEPRGYSEVIDLTNTFNRMTKALSTMRDTLQEEIIERKHIEEALRESETLYKTLFSSAPIAIYTKDLDSRYTSVNDDTLSYWSKTPIGHTDEDLLPSEIAEALRAADLQVIETGQELSIEEQLLTPDGLRITLSRKVPLRDSDGNIIGILGTSLDISERKQTEEQIRISQARFQGIVEAASSAIISVDDKGYIILFNKLAEHTFGYDVDDVLGKPIDLLLPERFRGAHWNHIMQFRGEDTTWRIMNERTSLLMGLRKNGDEFPIEVGISKLDTGDNLIFTAVLNDITERKQIEADLIEARDEAEESSRLKTDFLNVISHELRTPLTVMLGNTPLLTDPEDLPEAEEIAEIVVDIEESGKHLLTLVNDLLDLSRIEAGKMALNPEGLSVIDLVENVVSSIQTLLVTKKKEVTLASQVEAVEMIADPIRLKQILINLLANAVKFTDEGKITVSAEQQGEEVIFKVRDTGHGIPQETLPIIFDPFRQADSSSTRAASGTGLGLAITKRLVELHGGQITAESEWGIGSIFTFSLPLIPAEYDEDDG